MADLLVPSAVLHQAVTQLTADGHHGLAGEVERVADYLSRLAAAQTEIQQAADALQDDTPHLLDSRPPH